MALSIKNKDTEALARELARLTQKPITKAVHDELQRGIERALRLAHTKPATDDLVQHIMEIGRRAAKHPIINTLSDDEILGYDSFGAPNK